MLVIQPMCSFINRKRTTCCVTSMSSKDTYLRPLMLHRTLCLLHLIPSPHDNCVGLDTGWHIYCILWSTCPQGIALKTSHQTLLAISLCCHHQSWDQANRKSQEPNAVFKIEPIDIFFGCYSLDTWNAHTQCIPHAGLVFSWLAYPQIIDSDITKQKRPEWRSSRQLGACWSRLLIWLLESAQTRSAWLCLPETEMYERRLCVFVWIVVGWGRIAQG